MVIVVLWAKKEDVDLINICLCSLYLFLVLQVVVRLGSWTATDAWGVREAQDFTFCAVVAAPQSPHLKVVQWYLQMWESRKNPAHFTQPFIFIYLCYGLFSVILQRIWLPNSRGLWFPLITSLVLSAPPDVLSDYLAFIEAPRGFNSFILLAVADTLCFCHRFQRQGF